MPVAVAVPHGSEQPRAKILSAGLERSMSRRRGWVGGIPTHPCLRLTCDSGKTNEIANVCCGLRNLCLERRVNANIASTQRAGKLLCALLCPNVQMHFFLRPRALSGAQGTNTCDGAENCESHSQFRIWLPIPQQKIAHSIVIDVLMTPKL